LLYATFGSSRHLVVGPMSATAALSAAAIADATSDGNSVAPLTATLAIMTSVVAVAPRTYPTVRAIGDALTAPDLPA
jgi:SulP family sulfate permease